MDDHRPIRPVLCVQYLLRHFLEGSPHRYVHLSNHFLLSLRLFLPDIFRNVLYGGSCLLLIITSSVHVHHDLCFVTCILFLVSCTPCMLVLLIHAVHNTCTIKHVCR